MGKLQGARDALIRWIRSLEWPHPGREPPRNMEKVSSKASSRCCEDGFPTEQDSRAPSISGEDLFDHSEASSTYTSIGSGEEELTDSIEEFMACSGVQFIFRGKLRQVLSEKGSPGPAMEVGLWSALDDQLLEAICARLPFKSLFRVPSLSKAWNQRFRSRSFQCEVSSSSVSSWKTYAAVVFNSRTSLLGWTTCTDMLLNNTTSLLGYDSSSREWQRLPSHAYVQPHAGHGWTLRAGAGSLLCWTESNERDGVHSYECQVHVTNPLMRSWKQLPPRRDMDYPGLVHVCLEGSKNYKVLSGTQVICRDQFCKMRLEMFDSTDDSWTFDTYRYTVANGSLQWGGSAFINGVLYVLLFTLERSQGHILLSLDPKVKSCMTSAQLGQGVDDDQKPHSYVNFDRASVPQLLVCGSNVMLVAFHHKSFMDSPIGSDFEDSSDVWGVYTVDISVSRVDLKRGLAFEESSTRRATVRVEGGDHCEAILRNWSAHYHGEFIYIVGRYSRRPSLCYNVRTREWHRVDSATDGFPFESTLREHWECKVATYQPGLNPFLEV